MPVYLQCHLYLLSVYLLFTYLPSLLLPHISLHLPSPLLLHLNFYLLTLTSLTYLPSSPHFLLFSLSPPRLTHLPYPLFSRSNGQSRLYFYTGFVAYILGLVSTIGVMHIFKAAQPALLYLVPCCLGLPFLVALIRGDIATMLK